MKLAHELLSLSFDEVNESVVVPPEHSKDSGSKTAYKMGFTHGQKRSKMIDANKSFGINAPSYKAGWKAGEKSEGRAQHESKDKREGWYVVDKRTKVDTFAGPFKAKDAARGTALDFDDCLVQYGTTLANGDFEKMAAPVSEAGGMYEPLTNAEINQNNDRCERNGGKFKKGPAGSFQVVTDGNKTLKQSGRKSVKESESREELKDKIASLQADLKAVKGNNPGDDRNRSLIKGEIFELKNKLKTIKESHDEDDEGRSADKLEVGDGVYISGDVNFKDSTGEIVRFGKDKKFVVVKLHSGGEHSFHSSDVSENKSDMDEEDEDDKEAGTFYIAFYETDEERSWIGKVSKEHGGKWHEKAYKGKADLRWGQTYMSYLSPKDIMSWIHKDYGRHIEIEGPFYDAEDAETYVKHNWGQITEAMKKISKPEDVSYAMITRLQCEIDKAKEAKKADRTPETTAALTELLKYYRKAWQLYVQKVTYHSAAAGGRIPVGESIVNESVSVNRLEKQLDALRAETPRDSKKIRELEKKYREAVMKHADKAVGKFNADQEKTRRIQVGGKTVGKIGIDPEASPGNGQWYAMHFASGMNTVGHETAKDAAAEVRAAHKSSLDEGLNESAASDAKDRAEELKQMGDMKGYHRSMMKHHEIKAGASDLHSREADSHMKAYAKHKSELSKVKPGYWDDESEHAVKEGWKKEDPKSQEKTRRDREGKKVKTPDGEAVVRAEYKVPTFSQMVPYKHEIMVKFPNGKTKSYDAKEVRFVKEDTFSEGKTVVGKLDSVGNLNAGHKAKPGQIVHTHKGPIGVIGNSTLLRSTGEHLDNLNHSYPGDEVFVKESHGKTTPWEVVNQLADNLFAKPGFAALKYADAAKLVNMKLADKHAEKDYGEFGFMTLDSIQMRHILNKHAEFLAGIAKDAFKKMNAPVTEAETYTDMNDWKQAVKSSYPTKAAKMRFNGRMEGGKTTVSAEVPGEDRCYGVWDQEEEKGTVLSEGKKRAEHPTKKGYFYAPDLSDESTAGFSDMHGEQAYVKRTKLPADHPECKKSVKEAVRTPREEDEYQEKHWDDNKRSHKRDELEQELAHEDKPSGKFGIKINGKTWMKAGKAVEFSSKMAANKAASSSAFASKQTSVFPL